MKAGGEKNTIIESVTIGPEGTGHPPTNSEVKTEAINSTFSVNWNNYADGVYASSSAAADFGNISGWNDTRTWISGGTCRIKLLANALSGAGGVIGNIDISDGSAFH